METIGLGAFRKAQKPCFYQTLKTLNQTYGDAFTLNLLGQRMVVLGDTAITRDLLLKQSNRLVKGRTLSEVTAMTKGLQTITEADGEAWAALRATFQKEFSRDFVQRSMDKIPAIMRRASTGISKATTLDLQDTMNKIALAAICEMLFSQDSLWLQDITARNGYLDRHECLVNQCLLRIRRTPLWKYLPIPSNFKVKRDAETNRLALISQINERRKTGPMNPPDFLDLLVSMPSNGSASLSDDQLAVHMYGLIGAAYESTGAILHWALCHISRDPFLEKRLREELESAGHLSSTTYPHLKLFQNVIWETMRIYPPFPMLIRECKEEITSPVRIPKGAFVFCLIETSQKDPEVWGPDAQEFRPDRFNELTSAQKTAFFPFGLGKRVCLGESLARQELPALLAHVLKDFRPSLHSEFPEPLLKFAYGPSKPTMMKFDLESDHQLLRFSAHRASRNTENSIERTEPDGTGHQRNKTDQTPHRFWTKEDQAQDPNS